VCLLLAGCAADHRAVLTEAHGLDEDSPVYVAGVQVGEVQSLRVTGQGVEVGFAIESKHDIPLHADACVLATELQGKSALIVIPGGNGAHDAAQPLPQCRLPAEELAQALQTFVGVFGGTLQQVLQAWSATAPTFVPPPPPPPAPALPAPPAPAPAPPGP